MFLNHVEWIGTLVQLQIGLLGNSLLTVRCCNVQAPHKLEVVRG